MYVIAGVTGQVGSVVASELLSNREKTRAIVRDEKKGQPWARRGAEIAVGSLDDTEFLSVALRGARGFFTLLPPDLSASDLYAAQRARADAIARAVRQAGVPHVVMLSSVGADLEAGTGPIRGLHYFEARLRETGAVITALRASYFQENALAMAEVAKSQGIFPSFGKSADVRVPMIATKDVGRIAAEALRHPPRRHQVLDLVGPAYSARQVAQRLGNALGKSLRVLEVPPEERLNALMQAGFPRPIAAAYLEMYSALDAGKLRPVGNALRQGTTPLEETLAKIAAPAEQPRL